MAPHLAYPAPWPSPIDGSVHRPKQASPHLLESKEGREDSGGPQGGALGPAGGASSRGDTAEAPARLSKSSPGGGGGSMQRAVCVGRREV